MNATRSEKKYFYIKLMKSGRSLKEAKALFESVSMALDKEYTSTKDIADLLALEGGIKRLEMTRGRYTDVMKIKFSPRRIRKDMIEEVLSKFITGYKGIIPHSWKRHGNLIRKGQPNKPRPGSSKGKIGMTSVIGAARVLRDFKTLIATLQKLQGKGGKTNTRDLQKAYKSVRIKAIPKG